MRRKAQVTIVEMITSVTILFIVFSILFPGFSYKSRWNEALILLKGRDMLLTADRINKLSDYSFSPASLENFVNSIFPKKDVVVWSETESVKNRVTIACNCTSDQINYLSIWTREVKLNNREVTTSICYTNLDKINPCYTNLIYPDILVIWGYKNFVPYQNVLTDFLQKGNSILEIADLQSSQIDSAQQKIFGLKWFNGGWSTETEDSFLKPSSISLLPYQSYKLFYHFPYSLEAVTTTNIPVEGSLSPSCSATSSGVFIFKNTNYNFWVCDKTSVYFDTNSNGNADISIAENQTFTISTSNFYLNYIDSNNKIRVSFKPEYKFTDFLQTGNSMLYPADDNKNKILLSKGTWSIDPSKPIPVVIFNGTDFSKTVWMPDFTRSGFSQVSDDQKNLLTSIILSISNKKPKELSFGTTKTGYATTYLDVLSRDMVEIYKINLGVGFPF